jgi:FtsP/CotA-like multicopper oxidase with cupredoxin domain
VLATDGATPARPIRLRPGEPAIIEATNRTAEPLALHWHGLRGVSSAAQPSALWPEPIAPGERRDYRLTPIEPGTALWRPLMAGQSGPLQDRGLCGALIVEEASPPPADLDLIVVIDDWLLTDDNRVAPFEPGPSQAAAGRLGSWITVNGKPAPERIVAAPGSRARLRLLSACNARILRLRFDNLRPFVIAVDGQPTDSFEPLRAALPFAPGNRYDLFLDLAAEAGVSGTVTAQIGPGVPLVMLTTGDRPLRRAALPPIAPPGENRLLPAQIRLQDALRAELTIAGGAKAGADGRLDLDGVDIARPWTINGAVGDAAKPLFTVPRGRPVVLTISNRTIWTQALHLHGHSARLLHPLDDGWEPYWTDTAQIPEGRTLRFAFRPDHVGKWLISSAVLERLDTGLWTWFEVVER